MEITRVTSVIMSVRSLPKALQEKAITELNEVPNRVQEDIKHIQEWIAKQPHFKIRNGKNISFLSLSDISSYIIKDYGSR